MFISNEGNNENRSDETNERVVHNCDGVANKYSEMVDKADPTSV